LWDVATGQSVGPSLTTQAQIVGVVGILAFSPNGKTLAIGDVEGIRFWDVSTGQPTGQLRAAFIDFISQRVVIFSPDGQALAVGRCGRVDTLNNCIGGEIFLWDLPTGQPISLAGHASLIYTLAFSPDGKILVSGSQDATLRVWDIDPTSWRTRACERAGRNLLQDEWQQYFGDAPYRKTCENFPEGQ